MLKPSTMSVEDWDKMKCIFAEDHYIFYEFVVCAIAIFEYATTFARKMELLYSVLNSHLHCSSEDDEADDDMMEEVKGEYNELSMLDEDQTQVAAAEAMMQLGSFQCFSTLSSVFKYSKTMAQCGGGCNGVMNFGNGKSRNGNGDSSSNGNGTRKKNGNKTNECLEELSKTIRECYDQCLEKVNKDSKKDGY
ncbi:hypothetical protein V9T40_004200 [Parthenolecanium corni]|uniref:Uncharacterized protein n=1 Tax=Parthenolecanium corni TaxID=536013 RepID=A0AAN9TUG3_9HEMI